MSLMKIVWAIFVKKARKTETQYNGTSGRLILPKSWLRTISWAGDCRISTRLATNHTKLIPSLSLVWIKLSLFSARHFNYIFVSLDGDIGNQVSCLGFPVPGRPGFPHKQHRKLLAMNLQTNIKEHSYHLPVVHGRDPRPLISHHRIHSNSSSISSPHFSLWRPVCLP